MSPRLSAIVVLCALVVFAASAEKTFRLSTKIEFEEFKKKYQRSYESEEEDAKRFGIFQENMKRAHEMQLRNPLATFGVNNFSDMSAAEFKIRHSAEKYFAAKQAKKKESVKPIYTDDQLKLRGSAIDWRDYNAVTYVKNQGQCGCCWSFSSTGSIEGQWAIAGNGLVALSEQELVSCDQGGGNSGCQGGMMDAAWEWLVDTQGGQIATEASYPFVSGAGAVPGCTSGTIGATITGNEDLPQSEAQMATWMYTNGPISIGVDATSWQTYNGGILSDCVSEQLDHAVLAIGFNEASSTPYWIIKNSWGASWGEAGYIYVAMGSNQCLLADSPCTSVVGGGSDWHKVKRPPKAPRIHVKGHSH
jgi:cathepsin F/cysteine peptidase B